MKEKIIVIVGPTAVGKTSLGIQLAKALDGEVINGDSMQVYKQLDIGTAKVTVEEAKGITHHLIDIKQPDEPYTVADFKADATKKIKDISSRGKVPIVVGGTGLYIESLLYNVSHGGKAEPNDQFREEMQQIVDEQGRDYLHQLLREKDSSAADSIHKNNVRRVIRALEVIHETGELFSDFQSERQLEPVFDAFIIGLTTDRDVLYKRINERVENMIDNGLVDEAKLLYHTVPKDSQSTKGIGYKEFFPYFETKQEWDETVALVKQHSRNYAKRQLTWFRNRFDVDLWVDSVADSKQIETLIEIGRKHMESD